MNKHVVIDMDMDRGKKAAINSATNILCQVITAICGFILPRLILDRFGASYHGITASVTQFMSYIALLRAGVGGATRASLYKSLAAKDTEQISRTIRATEIFMRKIALIFLGFILVFACAYPFLVRNEFSWLFAFTLVLVISLSTFIQYFFGITYQILFQADQRQYISLSFDILTVILNTIIAVILIKAGVGLHGVKLGSALVYCISPIAMNIIATRAYHLDKKAEPDYSSISQRWDAFFHQLASFIHNDTDIALLNIFSTQTIVSIYSCYYMVAGSLKNIMNTLSVGVESAFGNIIACHEDEVLKENLGHYETLLHVTASFLFGASLVLITPFVQVYTIKVEGVDYTRYLFGYLAIIGETLYVLRSPYEALVNAAGHYKQTKKYAFIEAGINIVTSVILVQFIGLTGVVIGTVIAITYRNIVYATYSSREIVHRPVYFCIKRFAITAVTMTLIVILSGFIPEPEMKSFLNWIIYAIGVSLVSGAVTVIFNLAFYRKELIAMLKKVWSIISRLWKK